MKLKTVLAVVAFCAISAYPAKAWTCPSGQIRQQAPAGTPTTTPGYDVVQGIPFICVPATPAASQTQTQTQQQTQVANGGNAKSNSKSSSKSSSSSTSAAVSVSSSNSTSNANGNGDNSNNTSFNYPRQVASAIAPETFPTVTCFKTGSVAGQGGVFGFSVGGGRIDENCASLEAARQAPSLIARCKIYITNKYVKRAGVTMDDCLQIAQPVIVQPPVTPIFAPQPIIINIPPVVEPPITVNFELPVPAPVAPPAPKVFHKRVVKPCVNN